MSNPWIPNTELVFINRGGGGYDEESVHAYVDKLNARIEMLESRLKKTMASKDSYVDTFQELFEKGILTREEIMPILEPARIKNCKLHGVSSIE